MFYLMKYVMLLVVVTLKCEIIYASTPTPPITKLVGCVCVCVGGGGGVLEPLHLSVHVCGFCPNSKYLLKCWTFCNQIWYGGVLWAGVSCWKTDLLLSRSRSQWSFYNQNMTFSTTGKPVMMGHHWDRPYVSLHDMCPLMTGAQF